MCKMYVRMDLALYRGGKKMSEKKHRVSRRQFLNYTLTGVGGFMAAGMLVPMARFALDPVLKASAETDMVAVGQESDITNKPKRFDFKVTQVDAWVTSEEPLAAWVYRKENGEILAMSPICTHLGCTINWNSQEEFTNEFYCPCHGGRYEQNGKNIAGTPPPRPLDVYAYEVKDGTLYLGKISQRQEV